MAVSFFERFALIDLSSMRRMQLIEVLDQTWFPRSLRDATTDTLQFILNLGNLYKPIVPRLRKAFEDASTHQVLDLCSGGGGPWTQLYRVFEEEENFPVDISLTDKYPNLGAFEHARTASQNKINFQTDPVDAKRIPAELKGFRTLFTSFHHFPPREARAILQSAVDTQQGIGIFEAARRHPLTIFFIFLLPVVALVLVPFVRPFRWSRLIWTYLVPVVPLVLLFDGLVSCIRTYSPRELRELIGGLSANAYKWDMGEEKGGLLPISITYLVGYPDPKRTGFFSRCAARPPFEPITCSRASSVARRRSWESLP